MAEYASRIAGILLAAAAMLIPPAVKTGVNDPQIANRATTLIVGRVSADPVTIISKLVPMAGFLAGMHEGSGGRTVRKAPYRTKRYDAISAPVVRDMQDLRQPHPLIRDAL